MAFVPPRQASRTATGHPLAGPPWWADVDPGMRVLFDKIGVALCGGGDAAWIDAQNTLQDLIEERRDLRRGPGG